MVFKKASLLVFLIAFVFSIDIYAQNPQVQTPQVQPAQEDFPAYIVRPSEDLNPYGMSSIENSTEKDYNTGESTLSNKNTKRSNADINKALDERKKQEKETETTVTNEDESATTTTSETGENEYDYEDYVEEISNEAGNAEPSNATKLIYWKDDKGNMHITNDIANVPPKFIDTVVYK